ncbi:TonB-dependent receptor domain-containing protein [Myxococcus sp. Y35]|uniref:TonB-dependent receptor domain-containing protein n=1 Tax=Pseudomyxococcus flavus TaxID=3115648 RepID=UPI003CF0F773
MLRLTGVVLAAVLTTGASSPSPPPAVIVGTVLDGEKSKPLQGVVVTANAPTLKEVLRAVTDASGGYRIEGVPPGRYVLHFERDRYHAHVQAAFAVVEGATVRVDTALQPKVYLHYLVDCEHASDEWLHPATPHLEPRRLQKLALSRPMGQAGGLRAAERLAELVPGVLDVPYGFSVRGATAFENGFLLEGLSTRDALSGLNLLPLSLELVRTVTVHAGGAMPDRGRASGGILETRLKPGCSCFYGSAFAYWTPGGLEGTRKPRGGAGTGFSTRDGLVNLGDFGVTLGGPLLRNRLSFFAGVTPVLSRIEQHGTQVEQRGVQAVGRLMYQPTPDHGVSLSVLGTPSVLRELEASRVSRESDVDTVMAMVDYAGQVLDKRLLLKLTAGWLNQQVSRHASTGETRRQQRRFQAKARGLYLLNVVGTHHLEVGLDTEHTVHDRMLPVESRSASTVLGGYVQDRWNVSPYFAVNGGLRYDVQSLRAATGGRSVLTRYQLSPRAGIVVTPTAHFGTAFVAHFARYHDQVPLGLVDTGQPLPVTIDPGLRPTSLNEFLLAASREFSPIRNGNLSLQVTAQYTRRNLDGALASILTPGEDGVLIGNPGSGLTAALPKAVRNHDAVTLSLHAYHRQWKSELSYTRSRLHGNQTDPLGAEAGRPLPRQQLLPADRTHSIKFTSTRPFYLSYTHAMWAGLTYQGVSGTPLEGGVGRAPWIHVLDAHVSLEQSLPRRQSLSFNLDALNLLNAQPPARMDARIPMEMAGPSPLRPLSPRQVRFGVRYTF